MKLSSECPKVIQFECLKVCQVQDFLKLDSEVIWNDFSKISLKTEENLTEEDSEIQSLNWGSLILDLEYLESLKVLKISNLSLN